MLISIIITVKNEEKNLDDLINSLLIQEMPYEIIFVDAYSEDKTWEILSEYSKRYSSLIKLYRKKGSRAAGRNYGVDKANGDYIAFVDGDVIVSENWLIEIRKSFREGADVVAGKTIQIGYKPFENLERIELFYKGVDVTYPSCNLAYRKDLFLKIGGFDEWFITAEDIDLNIRAVEIGAKLIYNPHAIVYHRTRDSWRAFIRQAFWNGYGRKQLTIKHGKLWEYYRPQRLLNKSNLSFAGMLRLGAAFTGYLYCKIIGGKKHAY